MTKIKPFKPYDLATLATANSTRRRVVEVISRPFPEGTDDHIKIRMVPGEPTTLFECSTSALEPFHSKYRWCQVARAVPYRTGGAKQLFPEDMLRYDCAALFDEDQDEDEFRTTGAVLCYRVSRDKTTPWTTARWASFSWSLVPISVIDLKTEKRTKL